MVLFVVVCLVCYVRNLGSVIYELFMHYVIYQGQMLGMESKYVNFLASC